MSKVIHIRESEFEKEVLSSNMPVFVDFWAEWCGPCRLIAKSIDELSLKYDGKVKFVKVNVDENPRIVSKLGIYGIPTLIIFKEGKEVKRIVGAASKDYYDKAIIEVLKE
ncbi:Thioredoxin 1 [archaeon HR06]|nr:Thioredoxin 1 [archaeon HR06]